MFFGVVSLPFDMSEKTGSFQPACPTPLRRHETIQLAHGGGGSLMRELLEGSVFPAFQNEAPDARHDSAVFEVNGSKLAFTTDSHVVSPLFFPGGDIGSLAVNGTVNDLAMSGAKPLQLSVALIIEEGFPVEQLDRVLASIRKAADQAGVQLATGDTKVVDKGKGDELFITTAGVGVVEHELAIASSRVRPGDAVILSGDVGRHGIAIMAEREGLSFETTIESDCAPLNAAVAALIEAGLEIHCLRDLTRGGLATALKEIALDSGRDIRICERDIPICEAVRGACEMLGLDPLYVANEGRMVVMLPEAEAATALEILQREAPDSAPTVIGSVKEEQNRRLTIEGALGVARVLDLISGEQLPRIC